MTTEVVKYTTEAEWLAERMKDITSTEVSALPGVDVNPYMSPWELFMKKKAGVVETLSRTSGCGGERGCRTPSRKALRSH